ncbi:AbiJ-NTD4 domain-containing protein [Pseudoalteromonas gelatinilytica]
MRKINLYSSRQKALRGEVSDVFQYDEMPDKLRVQIKFILDKCLGNESQYYTADWPKAIYNAIYETLIEEYGQLYLSNSSELYGTKNCYKSLNEYLINEPDVELVLDYIELAFKHVNGNTRHYEYLSRHNHSEIADNAIELLNLRFKENGCGYQFEDGQIFRVDSTHIHKEII